MTTGFDLSGTTCSTRAATSAGGTRVALARWPAFHSCCSRVSSSAAPASISCCASSGVISRTGLALICTVPRNSVLGCVAQRLERQHCALHSRRADLDAQVVEHVLAAHVRDLIKRLALDLVGQHARRGLADRAAATGECHLLDSALVVDAEHQRDPVATQRVCALLGGRGLLEDAEVMRVSVVLENLVAV